MSDIAKCSFDHEQIQEWADRHSIGFGMTDLRCAFEDAATSGDAALKQELATLSEKCEELQQENLLLSQQCQMWKDESATANRLLQRERDEAAKQEPVAWLCWISNDKRMDYAQISKHEPKAYSEREPLYRLPPNLPALIEQAKAEERERLNFVLAEQAFVYTRKANGGADTYQLWTQDEDEEFHVLHDASEFFSTPIDAVDAAIRARSEK